MIEVHFQTVLYRHQSQYEVVVYLDIVVEIKHVWGFFCMCKD